MKIKTIAVKAVKRMCAPFTIAPPNLAVTHNRGIRSANRIQFAGCMAGLLVLTSQCHAASQTLNNDGASGESFLSLNQLWLMTDSPDGQLEIERAPLPKEFSGEDPVEVMSLDDARRRAFDKSYILGASRSKTQSASDLARAAYAGVLPAFDIRVAKGRGTSSPSSQIDDSTGQPLPESTQTQTEIYGVLTQPLFDLGAIAGIRSAAATKRASAADEDGVRGDVNYDSTVAFYGAVDSALSLKLALAQQKRLERLGEWVTKRAEAGGASGADRERIQARVLAARSAVQDAIAQANQANINLSRLTDSFPQTLKLPTLAESRPVATLEDAINLLPTGNAAVLVAGENEEAARQERRKHQARFLPVVKFELSSNRVANEGGFQGWREDQSAMVVLSLPLFSGGADYYKQRAALARQEGHEYERLDAEREARRSLQIAFSGLTTAHDKIKSLRQQALSQARVVTAFDAQLSTSTRNLLDVFDAYQQYHQTQLDLVHTSVQSILLKHQIERVSGQLAMNSVSATSEGRE